MKRLEKTTHQILQAIYLEAFTNWDFIGDENFGFENHHLDINRVPVKATYNVRVKVTPSRCTGDWTQPADPDEVEFILDSVHIIEILNENNVALTNVVAELNSQLQQFESTYLIF